MNFALDSKICVLILSCGGRPFSYTRDRATIAIAPGPFFQNFGRDVKFEVIFIDNASPDGTQDAGKQHQKIYGEGQIVSMNHKSSSDTVLILTSI
jgi:hypothetical protein